MTRGTLTPDRIALKFIEAFLEAERAGFRFTINASGHVTLNVPDPTLDTPGRVLVKTGVQMIPWEDGQ